VAITRLLEEAFDKVSNLPEEEQNDFAAFILDELESERRWEKAFEDSQGELERQTEMKNLNLNYLAGATLIVGAVALASDPVYTSIKGGVVDAGGPIELGVALGVSFVLLALVSGIVLLRQAWVRGIT
jgi:hypothetical protein